MGDMLLFPFRLVAWVSVQFTRIIGLIIIQPLRLILAPLGFFSRKWVVILVFIVYGLMGLRLSTPYPVDQWYTSVIHYPEGVEVSELTLIFDALTYRETDTPAHRGTQRGFIVFLLLLQAVVVVTKNLHTFWREGLAAMAQRLIAMRPPLLSTLVAKTTPKRTLSPATLSPKKSPSKKQSLVHAQYGLLSQSVNDDLEEIADRLAPELQNFIGK